MSGGHWGYQSDNLRQQAEQMKDLFETLAQAEHIIDWAICADTDKAEELEKLWDLWESYFDRTFGG